MMFQQLFKTALLASTCLVAVACSDSSSDNPPSPPNAAKPTYYKDVAPIIEQNCLSCHTSTGVGAASGYLVFNSYEAVVGHANGIKNATSMRRMPPWGAVGDGTCGEFKDSKWMSQKDIDTLASWVDGGLLKGNEADFTPKGIQTVPRLTGDITEITNNVDYAPKALGGPIAASDDYRCNLVANPFTETKFITGSDVLPGNKSIVHHVLVMLVDLDAYVDGAIDDPETTDVDERLTNRELIDVLSKADDTADGVRAGWSCFSMGGSVQEFAGAGYGGESIQVAMGKLGQAAYSVVPGKIAAFVPTAARPMPLVAASRVAIRGMPVVWAPGANPLQLPADTGIVVPKNMAFVVQTHYNLYEQTGSPTDTTTIQFTTAPTVARAATIKLVDHMLTNHLTPGGAKFPISADQPKGTWDITPDDLSSMFGAGPQVLNQAQLLGFLPHMHARGQKISLQHYSEAGDEGGTCSVKVDHWDFNWQLAYYLKNPMALGENHHFKLTCEWNTAGLTEAITPGWGTRNEMCLMGFITSVPVWCLGIGDATCSEQPPI